MLTSLQPNALAAPAPEVIVQEVVVEEVIEEKIVWTEARIEQEIRKVFHEDPEVAVAIAKGESGLNPTIHNPEPHRNRNGEIICYGSTGIMQIGCVHNQNKETLQDVAYNIQKARAIYDDSKARRGNGWLPWGAYTNGSYKKYLEN